MDKIFRTESADRSESNDGRVKYQLYSTRWVALAIFCTLEMSNALLWVTFAPISDISEHYFGKDNFYSSITAINMLANVFLILYPVGTIAAVYTVKYYRPRKSLIFAGTLTVIGALLRVLATAFKNNLEIGTVYGLIILGQAFGAIAQPFFTNFAPALSGIWFSVDERDISTSIGAMCSPFGNAIGQLIPPLIVTESQNINGNKFY
jgi:MFS transporter, FLVCR family, MFS-domain-containing protein 7